jgi:DHA3 family tetracycline resistance protein-like MFS transporter
MQRNKIVIRKMNASWVYLFMAFFDGVVGKVTFTMSAIYRVNVVGLDVLQLVLLGTILETSVFLFEIPTGVVADLYSRRLSVIIGTFLMGLGFMLEGSLPVVAVVMLAQVVWGFGWTFISGARSAWITDEVGVERAGKLFMRDQQLYYIGSLVGIVLAVPIANVSLQLPYFIGGGLKIMVAILLIFFMPETGFKPTPKEERETFGQFFSTMRAGFNTIRNRTTLVWFSLIALFVGLYSEGWDRLTEPHLLANYTFPDVFGVSMGPVEWFAVLNIAGSILVIAANQVASRGSDTSDPLRLAGILQGLYAVMVVSIAGFALTGNFWAAIGFMLLFDMLRGVTSPLSGAFVNHFVESKVRATVLSMTGQIDALGQMAGGPIIGFVGRLISLPAAILTSAAILMPSVPLFGLLIKTEKKGIKTPAEV